MRGLTHYLSGLSLATFFKPLVAAVAQGNLAILVPAVYAYLPDFLDFKVWKFFEKWDFHVDPAPQEPGLNRAPMTVKVSSLTPEERYRFYRLEGRASRIEDSGDKLSFTLTDDTGSIRVEALGRDRRDLLSALGGLEEGDAVAVSGYLDYRGEEPVFVAADAPHPMYVAERVAEAIDYAYEHGEARVKVENIRMIGDTYRRFLIDLDGENRTVRVVMGPIIALGGMPLEDEPVPEHRRYAEARTRHRFVKKYPKPTVIGGFSGTSIGFRREGDVVEEVFLPWHREWSHSFTVGAFLAALLYLALAALGSSLAAPLALASMLGYWAHVVEDQLGYMGSNLLWPFTKKRTPGLRLGESGSPLLNFSTALLMSGFIVANLNYAVPRPPIALPYGELLALVSAPSAAMYAYAVAKWLRQRGEAPEEAEEKAVEEVLEEEEEEIGGA